MAAAASKIEEEDVVVLLSFTTIGGDGDREETNTIKEKDNDGYVKVEVKDNGNED